MVICKTISITTTLQFTLDKLPEHLFGLDKMDLLVFALEQWGLGDSSGVPGKVILGRVATCRTSRDPVLWPTSSQNTKKITHMVSTQSLYIYVTISIKRHGSRYCYVLGWLCHMPYSLAEALLL